MARKFLILSNCRETAKVTIFEDETKSELVQQAAAALRPSLAFMHGAPLLHEITAKAKDKKPDAVVFPSDYAPDHMAVIKNAITKKLPGRNIQFVTVDASAKNVELLANHNIVSVKNHSQIREMFSLNS